MDYWKVFSDWLMDYWKVFLDWLMDYWKVFLVIPLHKNATEKSCNCFPVNFSKFLRTSFLTQHLRWLLMKTIVLYLHILSVFKKLFSGKFVTLLKCLAFSLIFRIFPGFSALQITFSELWLIEWLGFSKTDATWETLIYQQNRIKNRFKHLWWSFFTKKCWRL